MSDEGHRCVAGDPDSHEVEAPPQTADLPRTPDPFRWQAFFQRCGEPLFLLSRQRRILFVNHTWEKLTGLSAAQARGLVCRPGPGAEPGSREDEVARALSPPREVQQGKPGRARRGLVGAGGARQWWDVEFFPLRVPDGLLGVLGKITCVTAVGEGELPPLPEKLFALREALAQRYRLDLLASSLPAMHRVADQVRLASQTRVPVLVVGEPGTGKCFLARIIHHQGLTREGTFAALDCARLPGAALTATLFGEGSRIWQARQGTCYLQEPGCLPRDLQTRLCDWLGDDRDAPGPRVIAGCSVDPGQEVQAGRLLEDLHCALGTLVIALPPLRQRLEDLPGLVERLLERVPAEGDRRSVGLTPAAWDLVRSYAWPGNLRELYTVLQGAWARAQGVQIDATDLPANVRLAVQLERTPAREPERPLALDQVLEQVERRLILLALRHAKGNKSRAAEWLSVWRPRLLRRMEALGITDEGEW
ncbi:MAG: sigma 54-interacting transcriptional regulator [Gemmataceae bacterium]|nr:sigma 54-interacting transcriptional regulator [Gemmataceae bacterium]